MDRLKFVEKKEDEIIKLLTQLVKIPSQNGIDDEREIAEFVVKFLRKFDFRPELVGDKRRPSISCHIGNRNSKKTLWFDAPLDTVVIGDSKRWSSPPFSAEIRKGKLYGRGSADCKAGIACFIYTAIALFRVGKPPNGQLILTFDADEQSGNGSGIKEILTKGVRANALIIGYPGSDEISIGGRGVLRFEVEVIGTPVHTGARFRQGVNAITKMVKFIEAFEKLNLPHKKDRFFQFGPKITVSQIQGGEAINMTPSSCKINVDVRLLPSQDKDLVVKSVENILRDLRKKDPEFRAQASFYQFCPAFLTDPKEKIVKTLQKNAQEILKRRVEIVASGGFSIGNIVSQKMKLPIISGFGVDFENVHGYDECIYVDSLVPVTQTYIKTAMDFF